MDSQLMDIQPLVIDEGLRTLIALAVREDSGAGDKTVELAIDPDARGEARIVARRDGVIAGTPLIEPILAAYGGGVDIALHVADGSRVAPQTPVATLRGPVGRILTAERVLLNFLGHVSGVASATRRYVDAVAAVTGARGKPPAICDTRKTTPGFRALDKYAVRCGGGVNDRIGLHDGVMLKDNHLAALREKLGRSTLGQLTRGIRAQLATDILLWLEVDTLEQLRDELANRGGADVVLLDNFSTEQMKQAVALRDAASNSSGRPLLEASGGITLETLRTIAETGVDRLSIGALTHSAPVLDLSMDWGSEP